MPCVRWPPWASSSPISVSPGCQQRLVDGRVGLRARVWLHVGVLGAEQRLGPVDRELLADVHVLAAAVVPPAGVALGVLVGQDRSLALEHGDRNEVLRRDHLERPLLAFELERQNLGDLGIDFGERAVEEIRRQGCAHVAGNSSGGIGALRSSATSPAIARLPAPPGRPAARPRAPGTRPARATPAARPPCSDDRTRVSAKQSPDRA